MNNLRTIFAILTLALLGASRRLFHISPIFGVASIVLALVFGYLTLHFFGKGMISDSEKYFEENPDVGFLRTNHYSTSKKDQVDVKVIEGEPLHELMYRSTYCVKEGNCTIEVINANKESVNNVVNFTVERGKVYQLKYNGSAKSYGVVVTMPNEIKSFVNTREKVVSRMNK